MSSVVSPGSTGPVGFPGTCSIVNVIKGSPGLSGRRGPPGQPGFAGNKALITIFSIMIFYILQCFNLWHIAYFFNMSHLFQDTKAAQACLVMWGLMDGQDHKD